MAQQPLRDLAHAFRPHRQVLMRDRLVWFASQYAEAVEFVARHRVFRIGDADPALAGAEARHALTLRDVFQIVPIMELVGLSLRVIERDEQNSLGHASLPRTCLRTDGDAPRDAA